MPDPSEMEPEATLRLRPSPGLAVAIMLGWLPLVLLAWKTGAGTPFVLPLVLLVTIAGAGSAARHGLLAGGESLVGLRLGNNRLTGDNGQGATVEWLPVYNSRLFDRLAWLELAATEAPRRRRRLIVTDLPVLANLPPDDFRRLRVWLRLGAGYH
jgi:toxin CptA